MSSDTQRNTQPHGRCHMDHVDSSVSQTYQAISHRYHINIMDANSYQVDTSPVSYQVNITPYHKNIISIVLRIKNGGILAQKWGKRGLHPNIQWKPSITGDKKAKRLQILMRTSEFTNGKAPILYQFLSFLN